MGIHRPLRSIIPISKHTANTCDAPPTLRQWLLISRRSSPNDTAANFNVRDSCLRAPAKNWAPIRDRGFCAFNRRAYHRTGHNGRSAPFNVSVWHSLYLSVLGRGRMRRKVQARSKSVCNDKSVRLFPSNSPARNKNKNHITSAHPTPTEFAFALH